MTVFATQMLEQVVLRGQGGSGKTLPSRECILCACFGRLRQEHAHPFDQAWTTLQLGTPAGPSFVVLRFRYYLSCEGPPV